MAESEANRSTKMDVLVPDEEKLSTSKNRGLQIDISEKHGNWLTVGEIIHSIQKPISIYVGDIVKAFHVKLCDDLRAIGKCKSPEDCSKKTKPPDLCKSCKCWFIELKASHEKGNNTSWHKNCNSARWSEDHWEVAKFFMPALGTNQNTVNDAESTDVSSLLNVLEWMKDEAFLGKTRVKVDLVRKLRSQVRNTWAHAPQQEITDVEKAEDFFNAKDFLDDLEKVFPNTENEKCLKHLQYLEDNGVTNIVECELQSLLLQRHLLNDIKEEITKMKVEYSSEKSEIEEHKQKLEKLECALNECSQRMFDFESLKENINKQFKYFEKELKSFRAIPEDIDEIRVSIGQIRDDFAKINSRQNEERQPTSCLPEKSTMFTAREAEIKKVVSFLMDEEKAVVSLHGGPGFGKTAIAVEVSHQLSEDHNIPVVFSHLTTATTVNEMVLRLCRDVGVNHENNPKSSLILWLKNIKSKVIFVIDDIDNLLEDKTSFYEFVRLLRKNSNQHCQIVTTSRTSYEIPELSTAKVQVNEMDDESCIALLKQKCPKHEQDSNFLQNLTELCGKIPLAMCIAGSRVDDFENSDELLQHLQKQPMVTLKCPERDQYVNRAINMSYEMLDDEQKETLVRLAVFEGSFGENAARAVIHKDNSDIKGILKNLVCRSLIKQPTKHRYSIHLLIKHFLKDQVESEEERRRAEALMVGHYLELGHDLTIQSYSKNGYKANREALKKEAHHILNVLKICCQQKGTTSDISDYLTHSKIYTTSARLFSIFVRTIISGSIVDEFLQLCAKLAEERKQHAIKIEFDCLLAAQERIKSIEKSDDYFNKTETIESDDYLNKMKAIEKEFQRHYEDLKENKSLCAHYYYQYGRYLSRISQACKPSKHSSDVQVQAREQLEKSLKLRNSSTETPVEKADKVFSLLQLGTVWKKIATDEHFREERKACKESTKKAQTYYEEATQLSQNDLGEHELTSACYKYLGDHLLLIQNHNDEAEKMYTIAKEMRENLCLDASEKHVFLLNNLGKCLTYTSRTNEAIKHLESARDTAEKLADSDEPNQCKAKIYTSLAIAHNSVQRHSKDAVKYAKEALEFDRIDKVIKKYELKKLEQILSREVTLETTNT